VPSKRSALPTKPSLPQTAGKINGKLHRSQEVAEIKIVTSRPVRQRGEAFRADGTIHAQVQKKKVSILPVERRSYGQDRARPTENG
jgi:hypothetical protein